MFEDLTHALETEPIFCFSLLIIWIFMLVLIYRDAQGLNVNEKVVVGLIFFAPLLLGFLFLFWSLYFVVGTPILIWLLYRNLLISGKGLGSIMPSSPAPPQDRYMEGSTESRYEANTESRDRETGSEKQESSLNLLENRNTDSRYEDDTGPTGTEERSETPRSLDSSSLNRCPNCGREVEDEWNVCIDCGTSLQ